MSSQPFQILHHAIAYPWVLSCCWTPAFPEPISLPSLSRSSLCPRHHLPQCARPLGDGQIVGSWTRTPVRTARTHVDLAVSRRLLGYPYPSLWDRPARHRLAAFLLFCWSGSSDLHPVSAHFSLLPLSQLRSNCLMPSHSTFLSIHLTLPHSMSALPLRHLEHWAAVRSQARPSQPMVLPLMRSLPLEGRLCPNRLVPVLPLSSLRCSWLLLLPSTFA